MSGERIGQWLEEHPLSPVQVDCVIAVMLKILDGKCKMKPTEKAVMTLLYERIGRRTGERLGEGAHALIAQARGNLDEAMKNRVYEQRVLAETMISRPVMKGFKAMIRQQGLLGDRHDEDVADD
ncbi:hypothetical protein [Pseudomonas lopnurensis]|uniref:hypothetical protein n=1 Tax=Pseudomonas lopnurensis TaxID=1477517 RepID=UPI001879186F|nr:hypothetical protein [Pseudomonas lopnurensis]MBE7374221.1 hypothetical protein [Pseudomonas lopnurensis]